jgi:hypothetical protein
MLIDSSAYDRFSKVSFVEPFKADGDVQLYEAH